MKSYQIFLGIALITTAFAEELSPKLAPLAAIYQKQISEAMESEDEAADEAVLAYLAVLEPAEKQATADGETAIVASLGKEMEDVRKRKTAPNPPKDLPKKLLVARRAYLKSLEISAAELAKKREVLNAAYLVSLGKIQPAAGTDEVLSSQIAEEKKKVVTGVVGPVTNLEKQIVGSRWEVLQDPGVFRNFAADGKLNRVWGYSVTDRDTVVVRGYKGANTTFKLSKDGRGLEVDRVKVWKLISPGG